MFASVDPSIATALAFSLEAKLLSFFERLLPLVDRVFQHFWCQGRSCNLLNPHPTVCLGFEFVTHLHGYGPSSHQRGGASAFGEAVQRTTKLRKQLLRLELSAVSGRCFDLGQWQASFGRRRPRVV